MPHRRLKEAAPLAVLHPAGNYVGKPGACWEAWYLCMVSYAVKDMKHIVWSGTREGVEYSKTAFIFGPETFYSQELLIFLF